MKYLLLLLLFCSCGLLSPDEGRNKPIYDKTYNDMLFGSWESTDSANITFFFDEGTGNMYGEYGDDFVWKSKDNKITYSIHYSSSLFKNETWSEDRYMTFTFIDSNHLTLTIEENEYAPEGKPVPGIFNLKRLDSTYVY